MSFPVPTPELIIAAASLIGLIVVATTLLRGWQGWLALKERELDRSPVEIEPRIVGGGRIEVADLKERVRKLEAIANGVDL